MSIKHSESIIELSKALVKFNAKVGKVSKDASNPFFKNKYATIDNIIEEVRPILAEFGLSILQLPSGDGTSVQISTLLIHESGEWLESETLTMKPTKNDPQGMGSAITYARRYSLQSFLTLNTGEDDDGNNASQQRNKQQQPKLDLITAQQLGEIKTKALKVAELYDLDLTAVYQKMKITNLEELSRIQAEGHIATLNKSLQAKK